MKDACTPARMPLHKKNEMKNNAQAAGRSRRPQRRAQRRAQIVRGVAVQSKSNRCQKKCTAKSQPFLKVTVHWGGKQLPPADVAAAEQNVLKAHHAQEKNEGYASGALVPALELNVIEIGLYTRVRLRDNRQCVHSEMPRERDSDLLRPRQRREKIKKEADHINCNQDQQNTLHVRIQPHMFWRTWPQPNKICDEIEDETGFQQ